MRTFERWLALGSGLGLLYPSAGGAFQQFLPANLAPRPLFGAMKLDNLSQTCNDGELTTGLWILRFVGSSGTGPSTSDSPRGVAFRVRRGFLLLRACA
jgi:hypothetical protein